MLNPNWSHVAFIDNVKYDLYWDAVLEWFTKSVTSTKIPFSRFSIFRNSNIAWVIHHWGDHYYVIRYAIFSLPSQWLQWRRLSVIDTSLVQKIDSFTGSKLMVPVINEFFWYTKVCNVTIKVRHGSECTRITCSWDKFSSKSLNQATVMR